MFATSPAATVPPSFESRWSHGLNPEQLRAAAHDDGPLLIVAGAGTGKTRTLVARVGRLLETGVAPERILLVTFTRRAAAELLDRVAAIATPSAARQVWGGTFHSVANRLLRQYGPNLGLAANFTVLDPGDAADLVGVVRAELGLGTGKRRFPKKQTIAALYSRMVNSQRGLSEIIDEAYPWLGPHLDDLRGVFSAYTDAKQMQQVLDYDDLLLYWRALVATPGLTEQIQTLFDHILVDEYQDTNSLQSNILRGLAGPNSQVTVVGDDAQSIYAFRAATVQNLWDFPTQFPGATTISLEQNFRSTPPILAAANAMLAESPVHIDKTLWTDRPGTRRPELLTAHDEAAQSNAVCEAVLTLREEGMDLRDQAVLYRANHHGDHLELELTRRDIPYVKYGGLKYLEAAHVKDLLALLRILDNPADQLAWHRTLGMMPGVGPATERTITNALDVQHSPDALDRFVSGIGDLPSAARESGAELRTALADCAGDPSPLTPAEQIERLLGFLRLVFADRYADHDVRLGDLDQLQTTASTYSVRSRFLTELTLDPPDRSTDLAGPPHLDDDWLTLSTIHSAKGCEWRGVHILHAADGNLPSDMALADKDGLEEERRLLYVAMTRAKDVLRVSFPLRYHTRRYGRDDDHQLAPVSRFLEPVRDLFDESATGRNGAHGAPDLELVRIDVIDEVAASVASLWSA